MHAVPEGKETKDLIVFLLSQDIRSAVENELCGSILGKESKGAFHPLSTRSSPVFLQHRFIAKVRDSVKIKIDDVTLVKPKIRCLTDEDLHEATIAVIRRESTSR